MTRCTLLALLSALTATAVNVPAWAQNPLAPPNLRSPVRSDPNTINPAPIVSHGAATGSIPAPTYHGQPTQTFLPNHGVGGTKVHVPGAAGVRIQAGVPTQAIGGVGVQMIDAGKVDNRVPANQWNAAAQAAAAAGANPAATTRPVQREKLPAQRRVDDRHLSFTREQNVTDPVWVMQSDRDGKGVAMRLARDSDENGIDDEEEEYYRNRYQQYEDDFDNGLYQADDASVRDSVRSRYRNIRDLIDLEDQLVYRRKQLIPYMFCKHDGIGLYRPWMYNVKWNYWYGCDYRPFVPGVPDRYSPIMTEYGLYPRGNAPHGMAMAPTMPIGGQLPPNAPPPMVSVDAAMPNDTVPPSYAAHPTYAAPQQPWQTYGTQAYGHGIHPGFDDVSYRPRHAGSYSPYVGPYGFGGRFNYGYGPYNYQWSGGYSGFGRTGNFNYWLPQSGLQY